MRQELGARSFLPWLAGCTGVVACIGLLTGCSAPGQHAADGNDRVQRLWPEPPNPPRYVYQTALRSLADIRPDTDDDRLRRLLTGRTAVSSETIFKRPAAVAARLGRIYVADPQQASVAVFDVPRRSIFRIGVRDPNTLRRPISIAIDAQNLVYVLDAHQRKVMVFDALGLYQFAVGNPDDLRQPAGVAVDAEGKRIFVVDRGSLDGDDHKVIAYGRDSSEHYRLGPRGSKPGQLNIPVAAAVAPDGTLLVLDAGNFRIQRFSPDGRHLASFGGVGNELGRFARPRSIAADGDGNIFVADASFNNVQIFNADGHLLMWIGRPDMKDRPGRFGLLGALAADETGRLYVADTYHNKIEVYRRALPGDTS